MSIVRSARILGAGDEAVLERFLSGHADSSMFLRSNARAMGLEDAGERLQGTYVAEFDDDGAMAGAVAHYWNGNVVLQAPGRHAAGALARRAVAESGRPVAGLVGPWSQVVEARAALGMADRRAALETEEDLFALDLDRLSVPAALAGGRVECRAPAGDDEVARVCAWRAAYEVEALGSEPAQDLDAEARAGVEQGIARGEMWILVDRERGEMLSMTAINARLPDIVQIGGVYTPPELRARGHARAVVAGQLAALRAQGARRAVLFTGRANAQARRAYESLGFRIVGDYGLLLFDS